jgi:DNA-binding transcriptional MerR regulator
MSSRVTPIALSIAQVAGETKTSAYTLRYYERIGLIHSVTRGRSGHRLYGPEDVQWVHFLRKLHSTGMAMRRMLEYAKLRRRGDATVTERRLLLEEHRADVMAKIAEQQTHLAVIDAKVARYRDLERTASKKRA